MTATFNKREKIDIKNLENLTKIQHVLEENN